MTMKRATAPSLALKAKKKETGAHFTPPGLASFIADRLVMNCDFSGSKLRVLDPSCGDGELLLAFYEALPVEKRATTQLIGMDLDPDSIAQARHRLDGVECEVKFEIGDFLEIASTLGQQSNLWRSSATAYRDVDVVIANPPYVRTQILGSSKAQDLASQFGLSGRVDLYHAFLAAMTMSLRSGGLLGVITSNRYLTTRGGTSIRRFLAEEFDILELVDLGDTKLFEAAVLPALFFGRRKSIRGVRQRTKTKFIRIYEATSLLPNTSTTRHAPSILDVVREGKTSTYVVGEKSYSVSCGRVEITDPEQPWMMATSRQASWLAAVDAGAMARFGEVAKIRVGVKTTADKIFIRSDWGSLPDEIRPEDDLLRPLISQDTVTRWAHGAKPERRLLYTHEVVDGRRVPIDFERKYPRAWAYLLSNREQLEKRSYVREAGRRWYEIWVPQDPAAWSEPKLVFPDISPAPKFSLDTDGYVVDGNCYWATLVDNRREELLLLMMAVANSDFMTRYHEIAFQNMLYSGRRRYLTQYVEQYPLPDPTSSAAKKLIKRARQRADAVRSGKLSVASDLEDESLIGEAFGGQLAMD